MKPSATLVLALTLLAGPAYAQTVRLYVFTAADPSGLVDKATTERVKVVDGLKQRLAKNKAVQLVNAATDAQVTVEVTSAQSEDTGSATADSRRGVFGGVTTETSKKSEWIERAKLRSGTFETELSAGVKLFGKTSPGEQLTKKVEEWLKQNQAALTR